MVAYRYLVRGRVQGVGYRYFAARAAQSLELNGFARNLPDGRVEVLAEGSEEALERFEAQLRAGPSFAEVSQVERVTVAVRGDQGFHIR